ncbi:Ricin-type beta-trefoil lectin domain-containing protein [Lentzea waywayandensis]|uniref:Ricin-type beta-trefoil lectin domain-containing protein n=1 Tax=Lentzea waywayandensis TaxID=84724 RepID=A0A1I6F198_9PSEU|nr:ricin-type beta-trefoil lectin domain protein [Lentzea waywayandensis]SFR23557.1 Ricin-type beta-trefoil lectin domain-containing protein [Lentzea waywayandensis]
MRRLRRAAVSAVCLTLGAAVVATPEMALAAPPGAQRPDVVNSAGDARPGESLLKDAKGRTVVYVEGAQEQQLRAAVAKAGGVVADTDQGRVKAAVPGDKLDVVASQAGVTEVRLPDRAVPMDTKSEGVGLSKADLWIADGKKGAGVKVGIIDVGFGNLADAQDNGDLPPTGAQLTINNSGCVDGSVKTPHGTAVAEVVHDMAPDAQLFLACIEDTVSFSAAADWLKQQGVQVITAAVGFLSPTGSRGDGTGPADSPADVVKRSRESGILWSVAAGNQARLHFAGKAADANGDSWVEFAGGAQNNGFPVEPGREVTVGLRWDAWPTTKEDLDLYVMSAPHPPTSDNDPDLKGWSKRAQKDTPGGLSPTEQFSFANTGAATMTHWVYVKNNNAKFITPFELFVSGPSGQLQSYTEAGSVTEPGTSPHVIAVGATAPNSGAVEAYSSRGPSIDGRTKPDLVAFDKVSTTTINQFSGTSAAAAHVAGAAALLKSANPALDAMQIQTLLQSKASPKKSDNTWGNGTLNLGAPTGTPAAPMGAKFTIDQVPTRVLMEQFAAGETKTLPFPSLPGGSSAVAITLSAKAAQADVGDFAIEVAPGDPAALAGKAPALNARGDNALTWQSLTLFAPLDGARSIKLRNRGNGPAWVAVERMGYFHPEQGTNTYFAKAAPARVLDTRGFPVVAGGNTRKTPLTGGNPAEKTVDVQIRDVAGVPSTATSVVVNLTGFEATAEQYLVAHAGGTTHSATTSVAVSPGDKRTNLVVVPIGADGKIRVTKVRDDYTAGVALDVLGWFAEGDAGARYVTMADAGRVADTATGLGVPKAPVGHGKTASFQVAGVVGVPAAATTAAVALTGRDDNLGTELSAVSKEVGWLAASQVATRKTETASGLALVPLGASGQVHVRNERGQTKLTADVTGYFIGGERVATSGVGNCVAAADGAGFNSIFDGRHENDLGGWQSTGTKMTQDGCEAVTANTNDVNWYAAHTYGSDYTLKLDWKATSASSDSGVFVGITNPGTNAGSPGQSGYEVQIGPTAASGTLQTGGIVGIQAPTTTSSVKPVGDWNTFELRFRWNTVTVFLNGVQVNEHGFSDATAASRNTFIGIQNDNVGDPVRFRNVRIKRDTPVRSGIIESVGGRCLDMYNADPMQTVVQLFNCHGGFAQTWTMHGGLVMAGGKCLRAVGTTDGTEAVIGGCAGDDYQQWVLRGDTRLIHRASGRCLTPRSAANEARLELRACTTSDTSQTWKTPAVSTTSKVGQVVTQTGKCLDVFNADPTLNRVEVHPCHGGVNQSWVALYDGTLRGSGKCLNVASLTPGEGSSVTLEACSGAQHQQWVSQPDGTLVNPLSGRCLTSAGTNPGPMTITTCGGSPSQSFRLSSQTTSVGQVVGLATKCLDVYNNDPNTIRLHGCIGSAAHNIWSTGDGTLRVLTYCLDIQHPGNGALVVGAGGACRGDSGQVWSARYDGTIMNPLSNRCLDVYGALPDDGTQITIGDCHGGLNQRWATPVNPS